MNDMDNMEKMGNMEQQPEQTDSGFTPITSQEEFNERIRKRLNKQKDKLEREFQQKLEQAIADATSAELEELKSRAAEQDELLELAAEENAALKAAKAEADIRDLKMYQARRLGLSADLVDNIIGTTPEEIERSAENLAAHMERFVPPQYNAEMGQPMPKKTYAQRQEDAWKEFAANVQAGLTSREI